MLHWIRVKALPSHISDIIWSQRTRMHLSVNVPVYSSHRSPPCKACSLHLWSWLWNPPAGHWCRNHTAWYYPVGPWECWKVWCLMKYYTVSNKGTELRDRNWAEMKEWMNTAAGFECELHFPAIINSPLWIIFKFSFKWFSALTVCWRQNATYHFLFQWWNENISKKKWGLYPPLMLFCLIFLLEWLPLMHSTHICRICLMR